MPRRLPSNFLAATVQAHFGLTQAELGYYLGVRCEQVAFVKARQCGFSLTAVWRLPELFGAGRVQAPKTPALGR